MAFAEARHVIELLGEVAKRSFVAGPTLEQRLATSEQQLTAALAKVLALQQELAENKDENKLHLMLPWQNSWRGLMCGGACAAVTWPLEALD